MKNQKGSTKTQSHLRVHCEHMLLVSLHVRLSFWYGWYFAHGLQKDLWCRPKLWPFYTSNLVPLCEGVFLHLNSLSCGEVIFSVVSKNWDQWKLSPHKKVQFHTVLHKADFFLMWASPKHVIKSTCCFKSEETIMVLDNLRRPKQVQLSRLKCKLIAVKFNGHQILRKCLP